MGEILRGVLDASMTQSNPAFYTIAIPATGVVGANLAGILQLRSDCYFMATAIGAFVWSNFTGSFVWNDIGQRQGARTTNIQLENMSTGQRYFDTPNNAPFPALLENTNLNALMTLPEYILFEPNTLLRGLVLNAPFATPAGYYITLCGIEYRH